MDFFRNAVQFDDPAIGITIDLAAKVLRTIGFQQCLFPPDEAAGIEVPLLHQQAFIVFEIQG